MAETHGMGTGQTGSPSSSDSPVRGNSPNLQNDAQGHDGSSRESHRSRDTLGDAQSSAAEMTRGAYEQGRQIARRASQRYPQARRYLERGTRAVTHQVTEAPLVSLLAVGAVGFALAWIMGGGQSRSDDRASYRSRSRKDYPGQRTGKPLIESDRVEGTAVYDRGGHRIGTIERVMLDKVTGRAAYAVMSFGGFLGFGAEQFAVPWSILDYDTSLEGYRTDLTAEQLRNAPGFSQNRRHDWPDRERERQLHDYYRVEYYWMVP